MRVFYSRCSTSDQNATRQLQKTEGFDYILTDYCSGLIPLYKRPNGSQIKKLIDEGNLSELHIHSIDRLGRNTLDCLSIWSELTDKRITIVCRNPNIRNIDENGRVDMFSELMMSILSTMSSFERSLIRERQLEGIRIHKSKNLYGGRKINTKDTREKFLKKERSKKIMGYLEKGHYSYAEIAKLIPCSTTTVTKVRKLSQLVHTKIDNIPNF